MSSIRLLELWEPPSGFRLASAIATTYELQADFLEEDLLPVALGLRLASSRGRDFRLELESALQDVEVSILFHASRYQPGLRRSPRIDLIPLPEGVFGKLHAKIALLRFVRQDALELDQQRVRLVIGSANLTNPGYRSNLEVAISLEDGPDRGNEEITAVRDAAAWLETVLLGTNPTTGKRDNSTLPQLSQLKQQISALNAVFLSRPTPAQRDRLQFVSATNVRGAMTFPAAQKNSTLTLVSPFWPSGSDQDDVVSALARMCGGTLEKVCLVGASETDSDGKVKPVLPATLVRGLMKQGAHVWVAASDPGFGCDASLVDEEDEVDGLDRPAKKSSSTAEGYRNLHAKMLLLEGDAVTHLSIGSFNLTRRGLGLTSGANLEAGITWKLPSKEAGPLRRLCQLALTWNQVTMTPDGFLIEPAERETEESNPWPPFLIGLRARRDHVVLDADGRHWKGPLQITMRDLRSRLLGSEKDFDPWILATPPNGLEGRFTVEFPLNASWMAAELETTDANKTLSSWPALPDLEARLTWPGGSAVVPVIFEEKHLFPVVERRQREDEQALIAWFLGLRSPDEADGDGMGHSFDPIPHAREQGRPTHDILSYLIRDFVHALPGMRNQLADAAVSETGLRTALLGPRSPVALAREAVHALKHPTPGLPRKTPVAVAFQLTELRSLLARAVLSKLGDGVVESMRQEALNEIRAQLETLLHMFPSGEHSPALKAYLNQEDAKT